MNKRALLIYRRTPGFEPGTCRSTVEFSTTELYPREYGNK